MGCLNGLDGGEEEGGGCQWVLVHIVSQLQLPKHMSKKPTMRQNTGQKFVSDEVS